MPSNIFVGNARLSPVRLAFRRNFFFLPPHPRPHPNTAAHKIYILRVHIIIYRHIRIIIPIIHYAHRCCSRYQVYRKQPIIEDLSAHTYTILDAADLGRATILCRNTRRRNYRRDCRSSSRRPAMQLHRRRRRCNRHHSFYGFHYLLHYNYYCIIVVRYYIIIIIPAVYGGDIPLSHPPERLI